MRAAALALALLAAAAAAQEPPPRAHPGATACPVALPDDFPRPFTATERETWDRLCQGEFVSLVSLDVLDSEPLPCNPARNRTVLNPTNCHDANSTIENSTTPGSLSQSILAPPGTIAERA